MRIHLSLVFILTVAASTMAETTFTSFSLTSNAVPPPSYELRCRGSKSSVALIFKTVSSRPDQTGATIVTEELAYTPSVRAAGPRSEGLNAGECSWVDRPVSSNEPYRIRFDTTANAQLKETLHGSTVDRSPTAAELYPDAITIPLYLKAENHYWSFFVYNTGKGYLEATGNSVWKLPKMIASPVERKKDRIFLPIKP